ncbi:MAG: T9SS type A sorting domain-containing protein [Bacteroidota bacterium]
MKKLLLLSTFLFSTLLVSAQCDELFISGMVEGYANNRALEIYNPTPSAINLSGYSVGRFSNGGVTAELIQLPSTMLMPYETYTVVLDKRDSLGTSFETPVWNGYQLWDVIIDDVTGDTVVNAEGDPIYGVQYDDDGLHLYGSVYREWLDLQGKADVFLCPVYDVNNSLYFNGNDAITLISGTTVAGDGSNILDVIGVIGEDPGDSWIDMEGAWVTRDRSLTRQPEVTGGDLFVAALGDVFTGAGWDVSFKNDFSELRQHDCVCDPNFTSTRDLVNQVPVNVYPNPATEIAIIESTEIIERVELFNLTGQSMRQYNASNSLRQAHLSLSGLNPGMYLVNVWFADNQRTVKKLIVK